MVETDRWVGGGPTSELSERYHRPIVTYREAEDGYKGGSRSAPDVDLLALFAACETHLEKSWGHPGAAGFRVAPDQFEAFERCLRATLHERYDTATFRPTVDVDAVVDPTAITEATVAELDRFGPFGPGHAEPVVRIDDLTVADWTWFGEDERHWKGWPAATDALVVIAWDGAETIPASALPGVMDVVGTLGMDPYDQLPRLTVTDVRFDAAAGPI